MAGFRSTTVGLVVAGIALGGCVGRSHPSAGAPTASSVVDSLSASLTDLELRRVAVLSGRGYQGTSAETIAGRIQEIQRRLRGFPDASVPRAVYERVLMALTAREARLDDELRAFRPIYTDEYPAVRNDVDERRILETRIDELRRMTSDLRDGQ